MRTRDLLLAVSICLIWAQNNVISKIVISGWHVPPLFFAAVRFGVVTIVTLPWLIPMPRPRWRIALIGLLMGAGSFGLMFIAFQTISPSAAAVVVQIGIPITALLSVVMLEERIRLRRGIGIVLTLSGVLLVVWDPHGLTLSIGLWLVIASAFAGALGSVLIKQVEEVAPLRFQAWVGLISFAPVALGSALFETGQWASVVANGWAFIWAVIFSALVVSVIAHTAYYSLIQRYEANLIAPLMLMAPIAQIALGVILAGDRPNGRMVVGAGVTLFGVLVIALRTRPPSAIAILAERER